MLECVVNISEGRRPEVVAAVAEACGPALLDVHTDPDHNRSVLTLAGAPPSVAGAGEAGSAADETAAERGPNPVISRGTKRAPAVVGVAEAAFSLAREAIRAIDLSLHSGVHPRLGAVDVVPFVPLGGEGLEFAGEVARDWGQRVASELGVPAFLYGAADPEGRSLPDVRRDAFTKRRPDFGPPEPHPSAGAIAVGARPVLVAVNCELADADLRLARDVARAVRERDGGLPGVRALGFALESVGRAQVSMNLTDLDATGVEAACEAVRREVTGRGGEVARVELVGLLPAAELDRCSVDFLAWSGLTPDLTIEARQLHLAPVPRTS